MLVAIISDIHDNVSNLLCSLCEAEELGCTHLLCTGDVAMLSTFRTLCEEWKHGIDIIFGNNEYDLSSFIRLAEQFPRVEHHGHAADISLNNRRVYLTHYPISPERLLTAGSTMPFSTGIRTEVSKVCAAAPFWPIPVKSPAFVTARVLLCTIHQTTLSAITTFDGLPLLQPLGHRRLS